MAGEDLTSSELADPARTPLDGVEFAHVQRSLENDVLSATAGHGMTRWFWGEGVCLLAATRLSAARSEEAPLWVQDFLAPYLHHPPVLEHVNNLAPGATLAELHGRARSRGERDEDSRRLIDACLAWYFSAPEATRAPNGALEHWPGGVWADTVYMAGQFLLRAGVVLERPELVAEAEQQWLRHAEVLQHPDNGLLVHGTNKGERIDCHWGRANAWFAMAGADILAVTGSEEVRTRLVRLLTAVAALQPKHGVWDVLLDSPPEVRGLLETSAAAGLGAALLRTSAVIAEGDPEGAVSLRAAGERAVLGSLAYLEDGELTRVSAGTVLQLIPFGYSVIRDDRPQPWGQGLAMEALAAWRETHPTTTHDHQEDR
ncbi:MAG: glycoside hydrolase family 88 protein [Rhodoglobus sp.]